MNGEVSDIRDRWILRVWLAGCQAAAIWLTWHLWQARGPGLSPNLPLLEAKWIDACQMNLAWPLLLSLVLAVVWSKVGVVAHCALLMLAIALDQMRIQPEFVSVAILLAGTLARRGPLLLARCHLVSLWCFAGLHKLACPEYWNVTGPILARSLLGENLDPRAAIAIGILIACTELAVGLLAILPYTRRAVPMLAIVLHTGIMASLVSQQWNTAVWPWNFALAACGFGFFYGWQGPLLDWRGAGRDRDVHPRHATDGVPYRATTERAAYSATPDRVPYSAALSFAWQALAVFVLLHPVLYYLGLADAYISWCVYSSNTPEAFYSTGIDQSSWPEGQPPDWLLQGAGEELLFREFPTLNVPFTPSPRVYRQYLARVGKAGDAIVIHDPRPSARWSGMSRLVLLKQADGTVAEIRPEATVPLR